MGKKTRRGPLNSVVDNDQVGEGSALLEVTEAVRESGKYNVWEADGSEDKPKFKVRLRSFCMFVLVLNSKETIRLGAKHPTPSSTNCYSSSPNPSPWDLLQSTRGGPF